MPAIPTSQLLAMEKSCSRDAFLGGLTILIKLLNNVIEQPGNPKYRSFKLENKTIKERVLSILGMKEFIIQLGFVESSGCLNLGDKVLINDLRINRDLIQIRHDAVLKGTQPDKETPTPGPSKLQDPVTRPGRPTFHGKHSRTPTVTLERSSHPFLANIDDILQQVLGYEDEALKEFGRSLIPVEKLRLETIERLRVMQKNIRSGTGTGQDPVYDDIFLVVFTEWFSRRFFTWVNKVPCKVCGSQVGTRPSPSYVEQGVRVEEIFCCGQPSKFYRYNDIATLLVTRQGRCGEYANCFTFLCRCLGYDARYIYATFDHVWTEVYSPFQKRWLHVDPSDAVVDSPLMYQHGWKRPVDYVLAFSRHSVCDVTWRYCNEPRQTLQTKRNQCPEEVLEKKLLAIYKALGKGMSKAKQSYLLKRMLLDSIQMFVLREPTEDERKGRSSGDLEWRKMRGEQAVHAFHVFQLTDEEAAAQQFNLRYSAVKDCYERFVKDPRGNVKIVSTTKGWDNCVYSAKNVLRKEEHDWKMVYLARTEETDQAVIEWKVDVSTRKLAIKNVQLRCDTKVYESGRITWEYVLNTGEVVKDLEKVKRSAGMTIRATLTGGKGDNAWQHTQLFRQEMRSTEFPFELCLTFQ